MADWNYDAMESGYVDDKGRVTREWKREQVDLLSRRILNLLQGTPSGKNLTKLDALLLERAKLERELERE